MEAGGSFALAGAGLAAIYLSQVRISLAVTLLMFGDLCGHARAAEARRQEPPHSWCWPASIVAASFIGAITLGGNSVLDRFMTLFSDDPLAVYYRARGVQLNLTFTQLLFEYPFGAGLGRWGMSGAYFGNPALPGIWAEIQITGWMIDGGVLMIVALHRRPRVGRGQPVPPCACRRGIRESRSAAAWCSPPTWESPRWSSASRRS